MDFTFHGVNETRAASSPPVSVLMYTFRQAICMRSLHCLLLRNAIFSHSTAVPSFLRYVSNRIIRNSISISRRHNAVTSSAYGIHQAQRTSSANTFTAKWMNETWKNMKKKTKQKKKNKTQIFHLLFMLPDHNQPANETQHENLLLICFIKQQQQRRRILYEIMHAQRIEKEQRKKNCNWNASYPSDSCDRFEKKATAIAMHGENWKVSGHCHKWHFYDFPEIPHGCPVQRPIDLMIVIAQPAFMTIEWIIVEERPRCR